MRTLFLVMLLIAVVLTQTPPQMPLNFTMDFNETSLLITKGYTEGKIYYDARNNRETIYRKTGDHDRYCGTVERGVKTPCNHYIQDNKRWLDFPDKRKCCFCCDSTHGCGILAPDWLIKTGAKYEGTSVIDGFTCQRWDSKGGQDNFYYNRDDENKTPVRLDQIPDDLMDFKNFVPGVPDEKHFKLPPYCSGKCGGVCPLLRGENNLEVETQ